ncbi:DMT family transporter [Pukyongiella litopenaei]|uniref:DMT family transporter n=2 Tax=Pukyongiella litopenaei TaxID=2605946 RepID=A0A2S0MV62_9RHOB|nr:DMT family transporter [Pukyongiella litopenaei]
MADNLRGATLLAFAAVLFTLEATLVRITSPVANEAQIVFFRSVSQLALSLVIICRMGDRGRLATSRPVLHVFRGLTSLIMWWLYYSSFRMLDLALATTLTFATSLFVVAVAAPLLGERVGRVRWAATILGFSGIVIAVGPITDVSISGVGIGLIAAAGGAVIVVLNRLLGRTENTITIMIWIGVVTTIGSAPVALFLWEPLALRDAALVCLTGLLGALGMLLTIEAYRVGEASALAPVPYIRFVIAAAVGMFVFDETPGMALLSGAAIVVGASILAIRHEMRQGLTAPHR